MKIKVSILIGVLVIVVFAIVLIYDRTNGVKMERDYQEGIKNIAEGKYHEAWIRLFYPYKANYNFAPVLYHYAVAMDTTDSDTMRKYYFEKIPDNYNGPLAKTILTSKKEGLHAIKRKEEKIVEGFREMAQKRIRSEYLSDRERKQKHYVEQLESILNDVKYSSSASDSYRAEQRLRDLREEYMRDPNITPYELKKLDETINGVKKMRR
jgi:hypothetical protein